MNWLSQIIVVLYTTYFCNHPWTREQAPELCTKNRLIVSERMSETGNWTKWKTMLKEKRIIPGHIFESIHLSWRCAFRTSLNPNDFDRIKRRTNKRILFHFNQSDSHFFHFSLSLFPYLPGLENPFPDLFIFYLLDIWNIHRLTMPLQPNTVSHRWHRHAIQSTSDRMKDYYICGSGGKKLTHFHLIITSFHAHPSDFHWVHR